MEDLWGLGENGCFDILSNMTRMFLLQGALYALVRIWSFLANLGGAFPVLIFLVRFERIISVQGGTGVLVSLSLSVCLRVFVTGIFLTRVHCMSLGRAEPEVRLF